MTEFSFLGELSLQVHIFFVYFHYGLMSENETALFNSRCILNMNFVILIQLCYYFSVLERMWWTPPNCLHRAQSLLLKDHQPSTPLSTFYVWFSSYVYIYIVSDSLLLRPDPFLPALRSDITCTNYRDLGAVCLSNHIIIHSSRAQISSLGEMRYSRFTAPPAAWVLVEFKHPTMKICFTLKILFLFLLKLHNVAGSHVWLCWAFLTSHWSKCWVRAALTEIMKSLVWGYLILAAEVHVVKTVLSHCARQNIQRIIFWKHEHKACLDTLAACSGGFSLYSLKELTVLWQKYQLLSYACEWSCFDMDTSIGKGLRYGWKCWYWFRQVVYAPIDTMWFISQLTVPTYFQVSLVSSG